MFDKEYEQVFEKNHEEAEIRDFKVRESDEAGRVEWGDEGISSEIGQEDHRKKYCFWVHAYKEELVVGKVPERTSWKGCHTLHDGCEVFEVGPWYCLALK